MRVASSLLLVTALTVSAALANDSIEAWVTPNTPPTPIVMVNGSGYVPGTYAVGTIQLFYTVNATRFTAGPFASFQLGLQDLAGSGNGAGPSYPVTLNLNQTGSKNLTLTPVPASFSVSGVGWSSQSAVTISIPDSVVSDPALNVDGTDLVGNLQLETAPNGSHLNTVTTVQVHIKLVVPTNCLRMYDFITDQESGSLVTSTAINVNTQGKVTSTNPYGQLSDDVLVVNLCGVAEHFDLKVTLDSTFQTNPHNNPGNAVFTYLTTGAVDPSTFAISLFGAGTPQGQSLCLSNVQIPAGNMLLAAVHMGIQKIPASDLPGSSFVFTAGVYGAGSGCSGSLSTLVTLNPVTVTLPYTVSQK